MLNPVGPLSPRVYWLRRALLGAAAIVVVVTVAVLIVGTGSSNNGASNNGASSNGASSNGASSNGASKTGAAGGASPATPTDSGTGSTGAVGGSPSSSASSADPSSSDPSSSDPSTPPAPSDTGGAAVLACTQDGLRIGASTGAPSYPVGASPALDILVTNVGSAPCSADLSDTNIELVVYFGDARMWGSHDCNIEPGSAVQTLPVNQPVSREIVWTGLSSNPGCTATRQRVSAGTYTLQPTFAGQQGTPVTFTFA